MANHPLSSKTLTIVKEGSLKEFKKETIKQKL